MTGMGDRLCLLSAVIIAVATCATAQQTMTKVVMRTEITGLPRGGEGAVNLTSILYAHGPERRTESQVFGTAGTNATASKVVAIEHCGTHSVAGLNLEAHEYTESVMPSPEQQAKAYAAAQRAWAEGAPQVVFEVTTVDTGETRSAFGHTAHRYITTTRQASPHDAGADAVKMVDDAWFLDLPDITLCEPSSQRPGGGLVGGFGGKQARPEVRYLGAEPHGLVLLSRRTATLARVSNDGEKHEELQSFSREIVELSEEPFDPALFEVPPGFRKVKSLIH